MGLRFSLATTTLLSTFNLLYSKFLFAFVIFIKGIAPPDLSLVYSIVISKSDLKFSAEVGGGESLLNASQIGYLEKSLQCLYLVISNPENSSIVLSLCIVNTQRTPSPNLQLNINNISLSLLPQYYRHGFCIQFPSIFLIINSQQRRLRVALHFP